MQCIVLFDGICSWQANRQTCERVQNLAEMFGRLAGRLVFGKLAAATPCDRAYLASIGMKQHRDILRVRTSGKSFSRVTSDINRIIQQSEIQSGLCTLFLQHTSASLVIQENADPDVLKDLATFLAQLVPEDNRYRHGMEGPDDMPAHIRTVLTSTSEHIPIANGRLMLGTWQGIYLWEHRDRPHSRELIVHAMGD